MQRSPKPGSRCRNTLVGDHDFQTVSSETVYSGTILALRTDQVLMPGGGTAEREIVEHYGAVAVAAVDDETRMEGEPAIITAPSHGNVGFSVNL